MKIESGRPVGSASSTRKAGSAAASGFSVPTEAPARASAAGAAQSLTPLDAILALQAEDDPVMRRARQARRGRDALDALERLERGLIEGRAPASLRAELETLQRAAEPTGEPGLDAVLQEIDIRLAVEAAKLERVQGR